MMIQDTELKSPEALQAWVRPPECVSRKKKQSNSSLTMSMEDSFSRALS